MCVSVCVCCALSACVCVCVVCTKLEKGRVKGVVGGEGGRGREEREDQGNKVLQLNVFFHGVFDKGEGFIVVAFQLP